MACRSNDQGVDYCKHLRKMRLTFFTCRHCFQAGNSVRDDIVSSLIGIISSSPDLHGYTAKQLYKIIRLDITQQPLVQVALWTLGQ